MNLADKGGKNLVRVSDHKIKNRASKPDTRRIQLVTWNVHWQRPPSNLDELFSLDSHTPADIYGIGLQEAGYFEWCDALDKALSKADVVRIKWRRIQGIVTAVYIKRDLLPNVTRIESEVTRTGFFGMWGNKGGVTVRLEMCGVTLAIVNCHLAAHVINTATRIQEIDSIIDGQKFRDSSVKNILDHDYVFWMGDLNFRLDQIDYNEALSLINNGNLAQLLQRDQLKSVMKENLVFEDFIEPHISFKPTFKFDVGTDVYDSSAKRRVPAYCDRILHYFHPITYGKDKLHLQALHYRGLHEQRSSDHKPVSCQADFGVLRRQPPSLAIFQIHPTYSKQQPLTIHYRLQRPFFYSNVDWVAIFKKAFNSFDEYLGWVWVKNGNNCMVPDVLNCNVIFPASLVRALPRDTPFVVCYFSKRYSLCGISSSFKVVDSVLRQ